MKKNLARNLPGALRASPFSRFCAAGHFNPFPVDQSVSDLAPGIMEIPPCGLTGNPQSLGSLFLFKAFEIDETDQFNLLRFE
jgi:hypothetical protein